MPAAHHPEAIDSAIRIQASAAAVWEHITNVRLEQFADPVLFRLLDVPKPLRADLHAAGVGGRRVAYFANGKRFEQRILAWEPERRYAFTFNPEPGFRAGYLFELSTGVFRLLSGAYNLRPAAAGGGVELALRTEYSLQQSLRPLLYGPIRAVLYAFQRYLLRSIKRNAEAACA